MPNIIPIDRARKRVLSASDEGPDPVLIATQKRLLLLRLWRGKAPPPPHRPGWSLPRKVPQGAA